MDPKELNINKDGELILEGKVVSNFRFIGKPHTQEMFKGEEDRFLKGYGKVPVGANAYLKGEKSIGPVSHTVAIQFYKIQF